jgi:predicted transcriptional regulator
MARRTFDVVDIIEILVHWHAGRSKSEIAQSLGVDRKTAGKYIAAAEAAGMVPGGPPVAEDRWAELAREWFPELADTRLRQVTWPAIGKHHDYIAEQLAAGVTVATIHQRLRDERELAVSVASLRRYVAANLPEETRRSQVKVLRPWPAEPGAEAQIDYGRLGRWADPVAGKLVTVWAFVMVLCCSRHMFVRPVIRLDQQAWSECHVLAFEFFSGVPARLVPDNLKTGVERPDLYDPKINRSYAELAAHYGCLVDPARAYRAADKPRVERPMPYVRDSFWRGREFSSLAQMQAEAVRWSLEVAGCRACRPLDGAAPAAVFAAMEKDALRPLPADPFVLATWARAKIGPDIHARVGKVLYSLPWRHIGKTADVRVTDTMVQFFIGGQLVKTHPRKAWGKQTDFADYPPEKIAFHMRTPAWCRRQAAALGPACEQVIAGLLAENALYRLRAAQGVVGLAERHDPSRLEAACAKAIAAGDPSYRTIKGILAAGTDRDQPAAAAGGDGRAGAFLHGPASFANVVAMPGTITSDELDMPAADDRRDHGQARS